MLRDFEYELLGQTTTIQLIRGLAKVLTMKTGEDPNHVQALLQFQKIVSHFYLVSRVGVLSQVRLKTWIITT